MQLVGGNVRVLRPGAGPNKTDLVVDAAKVEEIMGVPPEKVADVMALMGDSIDNIPGAKGIGEKGARELIKRFGSAEAALDRAEEVEGKRYREALENSREAVLMSKQLAVIDTNAPGETVARRSRDAASRTWKRCAVLYAELGFTSLLRDLPAAATASAAASDSRGTRIAGCAQEISGCAFRATPKSLCGSRSPRASAKPKASARASPALRFRRAAGVVAHRMGWTTKARCSRRSANSCAIRRDRKSCTIPNLWNCLRARGGNPARDDVVLVSVAPHHIETQPCRRGAAPRKRHAFRRAGRKRGSLATPRSSAAQGSRSAGTRRTLRDNRPSARARACGDGAPRRARRSRSAGRDVRDDGARNPRTRKNHLGTCRIGIQRQFAAATRGNPVRQNESRA